ncbi:hypothetical protein G6F68_010756 [Rhizopus microsporus]|nr:hypothetical protein G6F68_010756 [Rhizopus microsporus]
MRVAETLLAMEGHEQQAEAVEAGHQHATQHRPVAIGGHPAVLHVRVDLGRLDDGVLRVEAREERRTDQGQGTDPHGDEGDRHVLAQAAHLAHVLLVVHRDDDRAGTQEQQGLEERMGHQVEHGGRIGRHAQRHGHVAQLRQRGVRDDALDVVLHDADQAGEERGGGADEEDEVQRGLRQLEQRRHAGNHEDTGGHHRRGVDQCRDRGRAFHRVRQPHVQRDLGRLAHGADEQADADDGGDRPDHRLVQQLHAQDRAVPDLQLGARVGQHAGLREHLRVVQGAEHPQHAGDAQQEAEVTDAVDQERLHVGEDRGRALEPEADQQVRHQAHRFPAEEQLHHVVRHHQHQHGEREQRDMCTISDTEVTTTIIMADSGSIRKPISSLVWPMRLQV